MAKPSFVNHAQKLYSSAGRAFRGEGILSVTKAMLESSVSYPMLALMPWPVELNLCQCRVVGDSNDALG
jgi:hypothetical protein